MELQFANNNAVLLPFTQQADEYSLFTLASRGSDFVLEAIDSAGKTLSESYNEPGLMLHQLWLSGRECAQCTISIEADTSELTNPTYALSIQTFTASDQTRIETETHLAAAMMLQTEISEQQVQSAVDFLSRQQQPLDQMRACFYQLADLARTIPIEQQLSAIDTCTTKADTNRSSYIAYNFRLEYARFALWFRDQNKAAINTVSELIPQIESLTPEDLPERHYLLGRALQLRGMIYSQQGDYTRSEQDALASEHHFRAVGNNYNLAETISARGTNMRFQNRYPEAAENYRQAYQVYNQSNQKNYYQGIRLRYNMAVVSLLSGHYYYALKLVETIDTDSQDLKGLWRGHVLALKARVQLELKQYDLAEQLYKAAWPEYENIEAKSHLATVARDLTRIYTETGKIESAREYFALAEKFLGDQWGADQTVSLRLAQVDYYVSNNDFNAAFQELDAIENSLQNSEDSLRRGRVLSRRGEIELLSGDAIAAKASLEKALQFNQAAEDLFYLTKSHYLAALAITNLANQSRSIQKQLIKDHLDQARAVIESVRNSIENDRARQEYFALQKKIFELAIAGQLNSDADDKLQASLFAAESFRARTLYESLMDTEPKQATPPAQANPNDQLLNQTFALFTHQQTREDLPKLSQEELKHYQSQLAPESAVLYFFVGEAQSYAWLLTRKQILLATLPGNEEIVGQLFPLIDLLNNRPTSSSSQNSQWRRLIELSHQASEIILQPFANTLVSINTLEVIPDGIFHRIPFGLLVNPATNTPLLQAMSIHYDSSIATSLFLSKSKPSNSHALLVVANPKSGSNFNSTITTQWASRTAGGALPATQDEAETIAKYWKDYGNATLLVGNKATKKAVLNAANNHYQILHFATHAEVNWDDPALSAIKLSPENSNTSDLANPESLTLQEISQLNLNADLVVLSACETAAGKVTTGEGPIGLSRAFFEAGAKRVLATLWPVDDEASAKLQGFFYKNLLTERLPPAQALAKAQKQLQRLPNFNHPYFWAGFILIGNDSSWL